MQAALVVAASAIEDAFKPDRVSTGAFQWRQHLAIAQRLQCRPYGYRRRSRMTAIVGRVKKAPDLLKRARSSEHVMRR